MKESGRIIAPMLESRPETATTETRKLAAIMFTDIVGFSRQMGADEVRMLRLLDVHNQLIQQTVAAHHGAVIKTVGDAFLVDFPSQRKAERQPGKILLG
jgi:class 3 adenylate cyclase